MAVTRIKNSGIKTGVLKYDSILAGNTSIPSTPTIGTATAGNAQATVAFTAGGIPGTTYRALSSPGSLTGTSATSPITVTGLTNGTAYTFQVRAENAVGNSAYSASSNSVTPVQPYAFDSIATATGTGSSGTITFSSIPSTYEYLVIRYNFGTSTSGAAALMRFNGDTGTNYARHALSTNGSSVTAGTQANQSSINVGPYNGTGAVYQNVGIIDIAGYARSQWKTVRTIGGMQDTATSRSVNYQTGLWMNGNAITSITLFISSGNFSTTSSFALYGVRG